MTGHLKRTTTDISERVKFLNCVVLRGYRTPRELIASMQDALNSGRNVAFVPTNKTMRHFFNTEGFRREMLKVADGLKNWEELIAADFYAAL
ncbi:MAG: hypothetical protein KDB22_26605 [Planctomycetales bacterium]|nr:hypothetical protein [Planctomycetales bacterium]